MNVYRTGPRTARLSMRAMTVDDAESFLALNGNLQVMRYTHEPLTESLDQAKESLRCYPDFDDVGFGRWGCYLNETGQMIGFCGLKRLPELEEVDVGFRFLPEFWGRGLATEAARASVKFGFERIGLQRIIGLVLPDNHASIRVLEKSGLRFEDEFYEQGLRVLRYGIGRVDLKS
ncbi:anhydro-N-acetylmuramic acid kinase [Stieleria maiorica]|uniref:Anhydro-N-acetylmuramic acid kinase n=1 Tax=Stieleria maiorica TaxID=2795974 RepID=A0A5B9M8A8_9BACT|nr:GNAT family N-acetyltransferase [Stieleria maiorica]QEF97401.1 anhydro-N-acetylmuramic acid kinase [Stieleria maiorica]